MKPVFHITMSLQGGTKQCIGHSKAKQNWIPIPTKRTNCEDAYQVLNFIKAKTFCICQVVQKTSRSCNLSSEGKY